MHYFWDIWTGTLLSQLTVCTIFPFLKKMMAVLPPAVEGMLVESYTGATVLHPHPLCQWSSILPLELSSVSAYHSLHKFYTDSVLLHHGAWVALLDYGEEHRAHSSVSWREEQPFISHTY